MDTLHKVDYYYDDDNVNNNNNKRNSKCRLYQRFDKTTDHFISTCPILAKEQYIKRHDSVC
jgi:hypothetical protein